MSKIENTIKENSKNPTKEQLARLNWDEMFINIALMAGKRTSCIYHKVGSVFVDDNHRIISIGYNGPAAGDVNCNEVGCAKVHGNSENKRLEYCRGIHSEINAICNCQDTNRLRGATLYVTVFPCYRCMKSLVNVGIKKIVYFEEYLRIEEGTGKRKEQGDIEPGSLELAQKVGIWIEKFDPNKKKIAKFNFENDKDAKKPGVFQKRF